MVKTAFAECGESKATDFDPLSLFKMDIFCVSDNAQWREVGKNSHFQRYSDVSKWCLLRSTNKIPKVGQVTNTCFSDILYHSNAKKNPQEFSQGELNWRVKSLLPCVVVSVWDGLSLNFSQIRNCFPEKYRTKLSHISYSSAFGATIANRTGITVTVSNIIVPNEIKSHCPVPNNWIALRQSIM